MSRVGVRFTKRQDEVLGFIATHTSETGLPPTRIEIARKFRFNPNAAQCHLVALQRHGFITLLPGLKRGIRVTAP